MLGRKGVDCQDILWPFGNLHIGAPEHTQRNHRPPAAMAGRHTLSSRASADATTKQKQANTTNFPSHQQSVRIDIDKHCRLCLAIRIGRHCKSKNVVAELEVPTSPEPDPSFIRSDNGPDFSAQALRSSCAFNGTCTATLSRDPRGRTSLASRSTDASSTSSATPTCSPPLQR